MKNDAMQRPVRGVKLPSLVFCVALLAVWLPAGGQAQVNSGSNGSDGAFNPTTSTNINMASRPSGVYQYSSVNIPSGVSVTFTPNVNNTPVVWLVQSNVVIGGSVSVGGQHALDYAAGAGGPGGGRGGNPGGNPTAGQGPGGGGAAMGGTNGGNASYGTRGATGGMNGRVGSVYGNNFLIPLLGGSGGGGGPDGGGGGGGGAILIASSGTIQVTGGISASAGIGRTASGYYTIGGGSGSGGAVRLVASIITGAGGIGTTGSYWGGGDGRVRFDSYLNSFAGSVDAAVFSQGSQFVVIPTAGSGTHLTITSVGGVSVSASPTGIVTTPDAVISAQQSNPIAIAVQCAAIPLGTQITVTVTPVNGPPISATGYNNTGTQASSTATVSITMPRGGGFISASAATGI